MANEAELRTRTLEQLQARHAELLKQQDEEAELRGRWNMRDHDGLTVAPASITDRAELLLVQQLIVEKTPAPGEADLEDRLLPARKKVGPLSSKTPAELESMLVSVNATKQGVLREIGLLRGEVRDLSDQMTVIGQVAEELRRSEGSMTIG